MEYDNIIATYLKLLNRLFPMLTFSFTIIHDMPASCDLSLNTYKYGSYFLKKY